MKKHPGSKKMNLRRNQIEDEEDMKIIRAYERGEFVPVENQEGFKNMLSRAATRYLKEHNLNGAALRKSARVNIRMWATDLEKLKSRAEEEGLPYQTLISSIIHKYVNGRLISKGA